MKKKLRWYAGVSVPYMHSPNWTFGIIADYKGIILYLGKYELAVFFD